MTPDRPTPDKPGGADLLETAARELRERLLPEVPARHRLTLLMALSAMGIAGRELEDSSANESGETAAREAARDLARRIRAGEFDADPNAEALHAALTADVRRRLAIANPTYLAKSEAED
jgi:hypothetical protein